jgi:uncharacterized protein with HEPN domain
MRNTRGSLIYDDYGVNYFIVWNVVKNKIPELQKLVREMYDDE